MKKMLLLLSFYALSSNASDQVTNIYTKRADEPQELKLKYIDSIYGVLFTQWDDNKLGFYIADGVNTPTKITKFNGFVSIAASVRLTLKEVTEEVCAKMQKNGKLYYINAYHQLRDISNETNNVFDLPTMPKGVLRELGGQLFFVVDPAKPYVPSAQ
jgi:hypothetical protein